MKINSQPIEKATEADSLEIVSVWRTIQGEGPFAGNPAVFVRMAGCNLKCPYCDTDYTSNRVRLSVQDAVEMIHDQVQEHDVVVFTGGEPMRQAALFRLLYCFAEHHFNRLQIETNGTLWIPDIDKRATIVCSPKTPLLHRDLKAHAFKYVLESGFIGEDGLPLRALGCQGIPARPPKGFEGPVYVQPLDEQVADRNKWHLAAAARSAMQFGYTLSVQMHKLAGLP